MGTNTAFPGIAAPDVPQLVLTDAQFQVPCTYVWAAGDDPAPATLHISHDGQGWRVVVCGWEVCDVLVYDTTDTTEPTDGIAYSWARSVPNNQPLFQRPQAALNAAFRTPQIGAPT